MSKTYQRRIIQATLLALSVTISFIVAKSSLSDFTLQIVSLFLANYILLQFLSKKIAFVKQNRLTIDFFLATIVIYTLIFSTGDLLSPLFFLIYFLLFGVALLLEPYLSLFMSIISAILFLFTTGKEFWEEIIQLSSLFFISPLAIILGNQYLKLQEEENEVELLKKEERILTLEIVDQEKTVRQWTVEEFKKRLIKIWENLDEILQEQETTERTKRKINEISNQLSNLLKSGETLEKKISK
jgi:hypothetical protein